MYCSVISLQSVHAVANDTPQTPSAHGADYAGGSKTYNKISQCDNKYKGSSSEISKKREECRDGFKKQVARNIGKSAGEADVQNNNTNEKTDCSKNPPGSTYKSACLSAYGAVIRAAAEKKGEEDARDNKALANSCLNIKYGGSATKSACRKKFKKVKSGIDGSSENKCGGVATYFDFNCASDVDKKKGGSDNPIFSLLITIVNWMTALVTVIVVGAIVYGGFLYMTARDSAEVSQTKKAISVIVNAIIALVLLAGMYAIINFIVPGGIFKN